MYELAMAVDTKSGQNAANRILTVIQNDIESSAASHKTGSTSSAETGTVDSRVTYKTDKAGRASSAEACAYQ